MAMSKTRLDSVLWWIDQLQQFRSTGRCSSPDFWKPFHFATLAITAKDIGLAQLDLPEDQVSYAARMGLWESIGLSPPIRVNRHESSGRLSEARSIYEESDVHTVSAEFESIALRHSLSDEESISSLGTVLSELMGNCYHHASPKIDTYGLTCAQAWPNGNLAQIAITDCGRGIRSTLSENQQLTAELQIGNACEIASRYSVTGKPEIGQGHSGYGLTLTRDVLELNGGNFILISGEEAYQVIGDRARSANFQPGWPGTMVIFEWNTDRPLDVKAVYNSWPLPEGMTDEDFDFFTED